MKLATTSEYALIHGIQNMLASMMSPVDPTGLFTTMGVPTVALRPSAGVDCDLLGVEETFQMEIHWAVNVSQQVEIQLIFGKYDATAQQYHLTLITRNSESLVTHYDQRHVYNYHDDTEVNSMSAALAFVFYRFLVDHGVFEPAMVAAILGEPLTQSVMP